MEEMDQLSASQLITIKPGTGSRGNTSIRFGFSAATFV
jgi:hypothetical protein